MPRALTLTHMQKQIVLKRTAFYYQVAHLGAGSEEV